MSSLGQSQPASSPDVGGRFAVAYVETRADAEGLGRAALQQYRDAVRRQAVQAWLVSIGAITVLQPKIVSPLFL